MAATLPFVMAANAVFNTHDVCVALMTQPNIVASDIAALACVNKTALRAARESRGGWRARLAPYLEKKCLFGNIDCRRRLAVSWP
jgi:hypothetical protein